MATHYDHYLGIGATGMLSQATRHFVEMSDTQTLVARNATVFVRANESATCSAVDADWTDTRAYMDALRAALADRPDVDLCVLWLHSGAWALVPELLELLAARPCRLIHVLGSGAGDPMQRAAEIKAETLNHTGLTYHYVALGAVGQGAHRRWLTHQEIASGVVTCEAESHDVIVGELGTR